MLTDDQAAGLSTASAPGAPRPSASATLQPSVVLTHPRDPGTFSGNGNDKVDIEEWLGIYERVAAHNRWDPTVMLPNLLFYLQGPARTWYNTHEEELTSWDVCKQKLLDLFGKLAGRKCAAAKDLSCRAQTATESYVAYILDVLALCRRVDASMPEADKVRHILKGIADDAFNLLVFKDCSTVDEIIRECRRFEDAKSRRIAGQFVRLPNTAATSSCEDAHSALQSSNTDSVVRIVRREIEAASPSFSARPSEDTQSTIALIHAVVREELANAGIQPVCSITRPPVSPAPVHRPPPTFRRYRDPAQWRTPDDKPICFHCSGVGHISRYCRYRQPSFSRSPFHYRYNDNQRQPFHAPNDPTYCDRGPSASIRRSSRSPSPHDRRSRSPLPRRFSSPHPSVRSSPEN